MEFDFTNLQNSRCFRMTFFLFTRKKHQPFTPPKIHMDTQNDGSEKATPFKHGQVLVIYVRFLRSRFLLQDFFYFYLFSGCFFCGATESFFTPEDWCWRVDASNSENGFFFSTKRDGHDCVTSCGGILPTLCFFVVNSTSTFDIT